MLNTDTTELNNLNCHPLEVVSRYRDTQLQVGENYPYLFYFLTKKLEILIFEHPVRTQ